TGLPVPLAVAIALVAPPRTAFAVPGAAQRFTLQLHHALGGKADHLAQECGIGALLQKRTKGDLLIGHRGDPRVRVACPTQPYSGSPRWLLTGPPAPDSWRSLRRAGQRPPTPSPGTRPQGHEEARTGGSYQQSPEHCYSAVHHRLSWVGPRPCSDRRADPISAISYRAAGS